MSLQTVCVFGATGAQGGSVVKALADTGKYKIHACTRDPHSEKAKKLCELSNVECVRCDLNNVEELNSALKGCWAVFGLTNFWDPAVTRDHKLEIEQGKHLVDAADAAHVKYFIYSSLPNCMQESHGKYSVPHFQQKNHIQKYAQTKQNMQCIFVYPGCYFQNFQFMMSPKKLEDGTICFAMPIENNTRMYMYDVAHDTGATVAKILESPEQWVNQEVTMCGEALTGQQIAETFSRVTGKKAMFKSLSKEDFKAGISASMFEEMYNMFAWFTEFGYFGQRSPMIARDKLGAKANTFEEWLRESNWTGPQ
jgi:uncharacterized protein YbjT (DUF2867 family)